MLTKAYKETNLDKATIDNVRILFQCSLDFLKKYGPIRQGGFAFEHVNGKESDYRRMVKVTWGAIQEQSILVMMIFKIRNYYGI